MLRRLALALTTRGWRDTGTLSVRATTGTRVTGLVRRMLAGIGWPLANPTIATIRDIGDGVDSTAPASTTSAGSAINGPGTTIVTAAGAPQTIVKTASCL